MRIFEDSRQQVHHGDKHAAKHAWWTAHGVDVERKALPFGDYMADGSNVAVDTKRDIAELMGNLGADYRRVSHECERAAMAGYRLVFLCEAGERYADPAELGKAVSAFCKRCSEYKARRCAPAAHSSGCMLRGARRKPFQGYQMPGKMKSLRDAWGAEFAFCEPGDAARIICDRLGVRYGDGGQ